MISSNVYGIEKTKLSVARYGNVFGSRGSFIECIKKQRFSGEVSLTHEEMTRFWITLDQGVEFVLMILERMLGGEIFVPKIPSLKIKNLIEILAPECKIKIMGIRPGEKLHEVLVTPEEARHTKDRGDYYVILPEYDWWPHHESFQDIKDLEDGFFFASHQNEQRLAEEQIKDLLSLL